MALSEALGSGLLDGRFAAGPLPISGNHRPTRHTRPTRPTLRSAKREAQGFPPRHRQSAKHTSLTPLQQSAWRCISSSPRYRRIRFNRECHPSWHLRRLASRRYASHRNPTASAQAVCHPLSGGSVASLVSACASLHVGDRALCAVIAFRCSAVQQIAVQCLQFALHCALKSHFLCARQGLKGYRCSQSVQEIRLAPILAKVRIDN